MVSDDGTLRRGKVSLHTLILAGFAFGAAAGLVANRLVSNELLEPERLEWLITNVTQPIGRIFLNLLFMVVVPIVFCSIALGVSQLGGANKLGRLTTKTFAYFVMTSAVAAFVGVVLVGLVRPGEGMDASDQSALIEQYRGQAQEKQDLAERERLWPDVIVGIVSRNPLRDAVELNMLPVIFSALLFGIALARLPDDKTRAVNELLDGVASAMVVIVGFAMALAPVAVPALIFDVTARFGWEIFQQLSLFLVVVIIGYLVHLFGGLALFVRFFAGFSPVTFFTKMVPVMITALSTSSSAATLPTTIKVAEESLGVPKHLAGFVLPLGATMNMNGTALFVTVVVLFLAQVFGVAMSVTDQLAVVAFSVLTAVAAAGVPSGSLPIIVLVLLHFGIPGEGLALVLGVERILDMGRTVVNVTGDATAACYLASSETAVLDAT
ncbi:MAG: dicarboxylate/amino acid:cation symporter [Acidobacteriota bacterium]|nr:MAG: dicarboxylate/amino acid:cation symporter [Acidobacteriota bacterium]